MVRQTLRASRRTRWAAACLAATLCCGLLAGCAQLPTSGAPQPFDPVTSNTDPIEQAGTGPTEDSPPRRLVEDFLRACAAGYSDDFMTAREYLLPAAAAIWKPEAAVFVYSGPDAPSVNSPDDSESSSVNVAVTAALTATLDDAGILTRTSSGVQEIHFELQKDPDGQWRIARLDDGIILSESYFTSAYQPMQLFFLAPDRQSLVPDPRWYPRRRLASHLVNGLLGGPSETIRDAVYSAFNDSLQLPTQGVEIVGQTAVVSLTGEVGAGEATRQDLLWQLSATLEQIVNVTEVDLTVNQTSFESVSVPAGPNFDLDSAVGIIDDSVVRSSGPGWVQVLSAETEGSPEPTVEGNPRDPARSPVSVPIYAWLKGDVGIEIVAPDHDPVFVEASGLSAPSIDRWGLVWAGGPTAGVVTVFALDGAAQQLSLPGGNHSVVQKAAVSPDGIRLLLLLEEGEKTSMWISTIERDASGLPESLGEPYRAIGS